MIKKKSILELGKMHAFIINILLGRGGRWCFVVVRWVFCVCLNFCFVVVVCLL